MNIDLGTHIDPADPELARFNKVVGFLEQNIVNGNVDEAAGEARRATRIAARMWERHHYEAHSETGSMICHCKPTCPAGRESEATGR